MRSLEALYADWGRPADAATFTAMLEAPGGGRVEVSKDPSVPAKALALPGDSSGGIQR